MSAAETAREHYPRLGPRFVSADEVIVHVSAASSGAKSITHRAPARSLAGALRSPRHRSM